MYQKNSLATGNNHSTNTYRCRYHQHPMPRLLSTTLGTSILRGHWG